MKAALALPVAALVLNLVLLAFTLPLFLYFRGKDIEIPLVMVIITLAVLGILCAQVAYVRKGKLVQAASLTVTALIQTVVMIAIQIFVFIYIPTVYIWFPAVSTALVLALVALLSVGVHKARVTSKAR